MIFSSFSSSFFDASGADVYRDILHNDIGHVFLKAGHQRTKRIPIVHPLIIEIHHPIGSQGQRCNDIFQRILIFSRIVAGEIPCHKVAENEEFFAFLDINPVAVGHTLVIPKKEIDYIFDIEDPMLGRMMAFAKRVARAQGAVIPCKRVGLAVMGLEVPHAHIHLIPIQKESDMYFGGKKMEVTQDVLADTAARIRNAFK